MDNKLLQIQSNCWDRMAFHFHCRKVWKCYKKVWSWKSFRLSRVPSVPCCKTLSILYLSCRYNYYKLLLLHTGEWMLVLSMVSLFLSQHSFSSGLPTCSLRLLKNSTWIWLYYFSSPVKYLAFKSNACQKFRTKARSVAKH